MCLGSQSDEILIKKMDRVLFAEKGEEEEGHEKLKKKVLSQNYCGVGVGVGKMNEDSY